MKAFKELIDFAAEIGDQNTITRHKTISEEYVRDFIGYENYVKHFRKHQAMIAYCDEKLAELNNNN